MDGQTETTPTDQNSQVDIDPWAAAFAALDKKNQGDSEADSSTSNPGTDGGSGSIDTAAQGEPQQTNGSEGAVTMQGSEGNDGTAAAGESEAGDSLSDQDPAGGLGDTTGADSQQGGESSGDMFGITEEYISEYKDGLVEEVRDRAVGDMAQEFIKRGIRHTNGKLGATIEDKDICKRDEDGVPHFYNPDTGKEFTGENPRRQAQEWCDDYNKELATAFNQACENYSEKLMEQEQPQIAVLEFAPKYEQLDPIRKKMFDSIVEDYEIKDDNGVIGYSCDLNKALNAVERQVEAIQGYAKEHAAQQKPAPTGPALDMKNSSGAAAKPGEKPEFKSIAEAMEWQQTQLLNDFRKNNDK